MGSARERIREYLSLHKIPQMFENLLGSLMIERPDDPLAFIEKKINEIKHIGPENVNWETFVYHLHPYRDRVRRQYIRDGSKFDEEFAIHEEARAGLASDSTTKTAMEDVIYKPKVFELTEAQA